jgi:tight adherence protein C
MILLLLAALAAAGAGTFAYRELAAGRGSRAALLRVASYGRVPEVRVEEEGRRPALTDSLAAVALKLTPGRDRAKTQAQLQAAGFVGARAESLLAAKVGGALGGLLLGFLIGLALGDAGSGLALAVVVGGIAFVAPDVVLKHRATARRERILVELPNALDLLAVIVEAGLGLDAALARYADTAEGPLADELSLLVTEMRVGASRAEVLKRLAERVPAPETKAFVRAIVQADQMGVSLSGTLRGQAQDVRVRRQAYAEERANKAPVKMLFPVVFCIFPILFVIVLGPAVLSLMESL